MNLYNRIEALCAQKGINVAEVRKIIKQISLDLNEDYEKLEQLFLTKEFPRTINYNSLLYFFSVYLEKPLATIDSLHNSPNNNELMALIKQLTPEQQDLVAAQIKGILAQKKDPSPKSDG